MPNAKSAKKRMRQNAERRQRNRSRKSVMRGHMKKVLQAVAGNDVALAETELGRATKKLDQAAAKNVIHRNTAARLKSRLSRRVNQLKAGAEK